MVAESHIDAHTRHTHTAGEIATNNACEKKKKWSFRLHSFPRSLHFFLGCSFAVAAYTILVDVETMTQRIKQHSNALHHCAVLCHDTKTWNFNFNHFKWRTDFMLIPFRSLSSMTLYIVYSYFKSFRCRLLRISIPNRTRWKRFDFINPLQLLQRFGMNDDVHTFPEASASAPIAHCCEKCVGSGGK